ncbi:23S rRNA (uracil(1939)-C(5))-methyltransferase RlmD [Halalkalibacillus halophilus]|uniref:23S rRNA (uracil(1939)-C(5))-methyltransferase RlmD n=1 Tax=Halalkalibacillus halophilus TaxID=392827 RepID=UPI0003FC3B7B|nr:23S rRNA (uracil(1939)-C(5))-methyltransferase RlmD [Halalkalibacillus halophilus]
MTNRRQRENKRMKKNNKKQAQKQSGPPKNNSRPPKPQKRNENKVTAMVTCKELTSDGKGIVEWEGKQLEVPHLLTGEKAEILVNAKGRFANPKVKRIIKAHETRVTPPCPYYYECGGCQLQHMSNQAQNDFKQDVVNKLMKPFGKPNPIMTMKHPYDYRNKSHMTYAMTNDRQIIGGLYASNSHSIIDIDKCLIQDPQADDIAQTIKRIMKKYKMQPYDEDTGKGFLRHVLIKVGKESGQVMVVLVAASPIFTGQKNFVKLLREKHPQISTVLLNINDRDTSVVLGNQEKVLYGKGTITDTLGGLTFEISSKSFYQINPPQTEKLYGKAIEMAQLTGQETVIDAYCGIGTIGLIASEKAGNVIGVEQNKDAVGDAIRNSKRNDIQNARFYQGDAGEFMTEMASRGEKADVVILDPPRSGSDEAFLSSVVKLKPKRVVYVSCNPETQARDMKYLVKNGYKVKEIQPVDMFPQTYHVESVCLLERA